MKATETRAKDAKAAYPPPPLKDAIEYAQEMIDEWDYQADPHGYCHVRPMLITLVKSNQNLLARIDEAIDWFAWSEEQDFSGKEQARMLFAALVSMRDAPEADTLS